MPTAVSPVGNEEPVKTKDVKLISLYHFIVPAAVAVLPHIV